MKEKQRRIIELLIHRFAKKKLSLDKNNAIKLVNTTNLDLSGHVIVL